MLALHFNENHQWCSLLLAFLKACEPTTEPGCMCVLRCAVLCRAVLQVVIEGWPEVGALPRLSGLKDLLNVQEGFFFDYQDIIDDRRKLEL